MVSCLMGDSTALASAIVRCCLKMENEQIAHHRQELEKAMRDIEQHDLEVAQKQELKDIQGHHFGGLSI